jgi:hypothetical protein
MRVRGGVVVAVLGAVLGASPRVVSPCALVGGRTVSVRIDAEEALIVWDAARRVEHFVRRADFQGAGATPFGFLVPTPSRPELADADEGVFARLADIYGVVPPPPRHTRDGSRGAPRSRAADAVQVVEVTRVAGLSATVLRASDPQALAAWLAQHGFASRPGLAAWLRPYTAGTWHLTAFRYEGGAAPSFGSRAVRLSFAATQPFYPYAEPSDQPQRGDRRLRVTVISAERVRGLVGAAPWTARTGYAGRPGLRDALGGAVPLDAVAPQAWMTTFEDFPSVRGARDLTFAREPSQALVAPSIAVARRVRAVDAVDLL